MKLAVTSSKAPPPGHNGQNHLFTPGTVYGTLTMIALSSFCLECVIGGAGRLISLGFISLRMMLFIVCFLMTLPYVLREWRSLLSMPYSWILMTFALILAAAAIYGVIKGNRADFIRSDLTAFMTLLLFPGMVSFIKSRKKVKLLANVVMWGAVFTTALTLILHVMQKYVTPETSCSINDIINALSFGGMSRYSDTENFYRIYLKSQMFLPYGTILVLRRGLTAKKFTGRLGWSVLAGLEVYATILSFTRGFWIGLAASCLVIAVIWIKQFKRLAEIGVIALITVISMFLVSGLIYDSDVTFRAFMERIGRTAGDIDAVGGGIEAPPEHSDDFSNMSENVHEGNVLRADSIGELYRLIKADPLTGYGLGKNLDGVREDGKTEYTYLDMLLKLGAVGFIVFLWTFLWYPLMMIRKFILRLFGDKTCAAQNVSDISPALMAGYLGMLVSSIWNPFLLSPMGMLMLLLLIVAAENEKEDGSNAEGLADSTNGSTISVQKAITTEEDP